jgi:sugar lactone lactonase YvrE
MVNRRAGLGALLGLLAGGCAAPGEELTVVKPAVLPALLSPLMTLTGAWRADPVAGNVPGLPPLPGQPLPPAFPRAGTTRLNLQVPVAVAARNDTVMIADMGLRQLLRLDRSRDVLVPLAAIPKDIGQSLYAAADGSAWLAEPSTGLVRQIDRNGRALRTFRDERFAASPVAVVVPPRGGNDVFVADAALAHIAVFNTFGRVFRRFGQGLLNSVVAMTDGPLGLYVVDRAAQLVRIFDLDGTERTSLGEAILALPKSIAVDAAGRVFVADEADGAIHVFIDNDPVAKFTGTGAARLMRIDAIAVDGNLLYVADSVSSRVQILLIAPESVRRPPVT